MLCLGISAGGGTSRARGAPPPPPLPPSPSPPLPRARGEEGSGWPAARGRRARERAAAAAAAGAMLLAGTNRNVRLALVYSLAFSTARSLMGQSQLSAFILLRTGSTVLVGVGSGVLGLVTFMSALPVGVMIDAGVLRRQRLLRAAGVLGACSAVAFAAVLIVGGGLRNAEAGGDGKRVFGALCAALALWGLFTGVQSVSVETTFADSVPTGHRSLLYTYKSSLRTAGNSVGPLTSIPIFAALGGQWRTKDLTIVMLVGQAISLLPCAMLFMFRDSDTLGQESEALPTSAVVDGDSGAASSRQPPSITSTESEAMLQSAADHRALLAAERIESGARDGDGGDGQLQADEQRAVSQRRARARRVVPWLVACADVVSMLGSGMSIKYFPIFFWKELGLGPVAVNFVYVLCPLLVSAMGIVAQRVGMRLGVAQTAFLFRSVGIALLVVLSFVRSEAVLLPLYVLRTALMNCTGGLTRGILNDYVPKRRRGFFNSLEAINMFSWSGSAVVGGVLVNSIGYRHTFLVTAAVQVRAASFFWRMLGGPARSARGARACSSVCGFGWPAAIFGFFVALLDRVYFRRAAHRARAVDAAHGNGTCARTRD